MGTPCVIAMTLEQAYENERLNLEQIRARVRSIREQMFAKSSTDHTASLLLLRELLEDDGLLQEECTADDVRHWTTIPTVGGN